jgi:hypothetical protein
VNIEPQSTFSYFEADLERGRKGQWPNDAPDDEYAPFGDSIEEFSHWAGFSSQPRQEQKPMAKDGGIFELAESSVNPYRGVGRNDPCPCGSGKKFKRCCLGREFVE